MFADARDQYYSMFMEMIRLFNGETQGLFLWDRGFGTDLFTNILYYGVSLFNIPILLMGEANLEFSMTMVILLKMGFMGLTAYIFFGKTRHFHGEKRDGSFHAGLSLAASLAYSLCSFVLAYNNNLMWLDGLLLLPILALSIENLIHEGKWKLYTLCLCIAMVTNFYFSVYICLFCFLYFMLQEFGEKGKFLKSFFKFALSSVIAALLSGIVLVPAFLAIMSRGNYDASYYVAQIPEHSLFFPFLESFNLCSMLDGYGGEMYASNNFCGCLVLILLPVFFSEKGFSVSYRIRYLLMLILFGAAMNIKSLGYIMHGFYYPHGMSNRFAFIMIFLLIVMAFETCSKVETLSLVRVGLSAVILLGILAVGMRFNPEHSYMYTMIMVIFYGILMLLYSRKSIKLNSLRVWMVSLWLIEIAGNCLLTAPDKSWDKNLMQEIKVEKWQDAYKALQTDPGERKTALINKNYMKDSETNWYSSMLNGSMSNVFQSVGLSNYEVAETTYRGTTPLTTLLFNVRYALSNETGLFGGYHKVDGAAISLGEDVGPAVLYEADTLAGMGFMASEDLLSWKGDQSVSANQNDFWGKALGDQEKKLFHKPKMKEMKRSLMFTNTLVETQNSMEYDIPSDFPPIVTIYYEMEEDADLYFWSDDTNCHSVGAFVDDELVVQSIYTDSATLAHIGEVHEGQVVQIQMISVVGEYPKGEEHWEVMAYDKDAFDESIADLTDEILAVDGFEKNTLKGHVDAKEDGVLYISLPYQKGYEVKIDGVKTDTIKIGTGFMGVKVKAGLHKVEISYATPGMNVGILLTILGVLSFLGTSIANKSKKTDKQESKKASNEKEVLQ